MLVPSGVFSGVRKPNTAKAEGTGEPLVPPARRLIDPQQLMSIFIHCVKIYHTLRQNTRGAGLRARTLCTQSAAKRRICIQYNHRKLGGYHAMRRIFRRVRKSHCKDRLNRFLGAHNKSEKGKTSCWRTPTSTRKAGERGHMLQREVRIVR